METGRKLGADLVASGALLKVGSRLKLTLELHDTRAGDLLGTGEATGKTPDELVDDADRAIDEVLRPLK